MQRAMFAILLLSKVKSNRNPYFWERWCKLSCIESKGRKRDAMLTVETEKWQQSVQDLYRLSIEAAHPRSRERYQALHQIASGQMNASQWSVRYKRHKQTVMGWVHNYNESGPAGVHYQRSGGRPPFFARSRSRDSLKPSVTTNRSSMDCPAMAGR